VDSDLHELIHILVKIDNLTKRVHVLVDELNRKDSCRELHEQAIKKMVEGNGPTDKRRV